MTRHWQALATRIGGPELSPETVARELRALAATAKEHPRARRRLLVLDRDAAGEVEAQGVDVLPAYEWMLAEPG